MKYYRNVITQIVIPVPDDSVQVQKHLKVQRESNQPVWEEVSSASAQSQGILTAETSLYTLSVIAPAVATAGSDLDTNFPKIEVAATVKSALYFPSASLSGANTNSRTLEVIANDGTTLVASLALTSGVNLVAHQEADLSLNGTPTVALNDQLKWRSLHVGTGITDPGGLALVTYA